MDRCTDERTDGRQLEKHNVSGSYRAIGDGCIKGPTKLVMLNYKNNSNGNQRQLPVKRNHIGNFQLQV